MATAPRPGSSARDAAASITITVDGTAHTLCPGELSAADVSALRRATREMWGEPVSVRRLLSQIAAGTDKTLDLDIDTVAAVIWLCRRQAGETVTLVEVMESINFDTDFDFEGVEDVDPLSSSGLTAGESSPPSPTTSVSGGNTSP